MTLYPGIAEWYAEQRLSETTPIHTETEVNMSEAISARTQAEIELGRKKVAAAKAQDAQYRAEAVAQLNADFPDPEVEVVEMKRSRRKTKVEDFPVTAPETFVAPPAAEPEPEPEPEPVTPKGKEPPAAPQSLDDLDEFLKS